MSAHPTEQLLELVQHKRVIVCCGAGGVGKTTTAAALGLAAARKGRRVLVLTIDPARRLAEAMGIPEGGAAPTPLCAERHSAAGIEPPGQLSAWMLDSRAVFEEMVRRLSPTPAHAEKVLQNRIYRRLTELVAGMQEYTAAEALYGLSTSGLYDLVVLDTPPSRNALDFLDAPSKLSGFLDQRVVNLFLPDKRTARLWKGASQLVHTVLHKVFGEEFVGDLEEFLGAFAGLFSALRLRAEGVRQLLSSEECSFLLVTSPEEAAVDEAVFFQQKLLDKGLPFGGFVLNRSWANLEGLAAPEAIELPGDADGALRSGLQKLLGLAAAERVRAEKDTRLLEGLKARLRGPGLAVAAPYLGAVEDLRGLRILAHGLTTAPVPSGAPGWP